MNIDTKLDLLKQIKEVDTPPFLLTRIKQQIQNTGNVKAPIKWKWAFALTAVIIFILNSSILYKLANTSKDNTAGIETVINSMNLATNNDIYNE